MNTKLFAGLALAAALCVGGPAFGYSHGGGAGGRGGGGYARGGGGGARSYSFARYSSGAPSIAYGGSKYGGGGRYGASNHYSYAFASHPGWSYGRTYYWRGNHYRWYGNGWFIVDPYPYYYYPYPYYGYYSGPTNTVYGPSYDSDGGGQSEGVAVQQALSKLGYYQGPIDGIIGPASQAAISSYQHDNGLHVTGTINPRLLNALDID